MKHKCLKTSPIKCMLQKFKFQGFDYFLVTDFNNLENVTLATLYYVNELQLSKPEKLFWLLQSAPLLKEIWTNIAILLAFFFFFFFFPS